MPNPVSAAPNSPMSAREKICHMVPTTFHGISIGSAITTSKGPTARPPRGMAQRDRDAKRDLDQQRRPSEKLKFRNSAPESARRSRSTG